MLRNRLLPLRNVVTLQLRETRAKSSNASSSSSGNATRQSKILGKFFGSRLVGSKKRWYPSHDATGGSGYQPPSVVFQASQFGKSSSGQNSPGAKHNTRRMAVLNKLFMTHITDLLATGEAAESILGRGLQVSRVKISSDFACVNVYWLGSGELLADSALEADLQRGSGQLRHELSQLRLMGEVPRIKFVRDKTGSNINHVEGILRRLDLSPVAAEEEEEEQQQQSEVFDVAQTARQEFYGNAAAPPLPNMATDEASAMPEMRHDVLGLDHRLIMGKILTKMRKSKQAWEQHEQQQQEVVASSSANVSSSEELAERVQRKLAEAAETADKFDAFLAKRRERKETPERKKYRREQEDWPATDQAAEQEELWLSPEQEDFIVEEDKSRGSTSGRS